MPGNSRSGRHPKPTHLKILENTRRDRINHKEPVPPNGRVVPPVKLSKAAQDVWNRLVPGLVEKKVMTPWDVDQFVLFCDAIATYHDAMKQQAGEYSITGSLGTPVRNPLSIVIKDAIATITSIGRLYGLSPADRSRIVIDDGDVASSGAERLLS